MMKILSLPLPWVKRSDEEHIELVRRQIRLGEKGAVAVLLFALLAFAAALYFGCVLWGMFAEPLGARFLEVTPGLGLGVIMGMIAGVLSFFGIIELGLAATLWFGFRTEKLLLKYYDMAKSQNRNDKGRSDSASE